MKRKSKMFAMRMTESDYDRIKRKAESAGMTLTGYITTSALEKEITVVEGLDKTLFELKGIGRNLNQLTTLCNMGKITALDLGEVKQSFGAVHDRLYDLSERA